MQNIRIYERRLVQFVERVREGVFGERAPLALEYTYDKENPIPIDSLSSRSWQSIAVGEQWGELWGSAWFRATGTVPDAFSGQEVVALLDLGSEAALFVDGSPRQGLTDSSRTYGQPEGKRQINLFERATAGERVELLLEAGANALFGQRGRQEFTIAIAELAVFNRDRWQLWIDLLFLMELYKALPAQSVRARRILAAVNEAANVWNDGSGAAAAAAICSRALASKAVPSATTAWSVGHAHLDLGWLWPVRETRRKSSRTFSTALRMLEEYPDYVFGASQPQAYEWVKTDYPKLYDEIKEAVKAGRWEVQGAMWVEPDTNVPSGESLVRQLIYGKRYFRDEFDVDVKNLWLPDVFGYSAALPQILRLAGVEFFMTQKISWNETNTFPHHTFIWEGIDGTRIPTHFLPSNTYNLDNLPGQLRKSEERFAQADVSDDWLNLYGIGDGGGGPGRHHIEFARRAADIEGLPKVRMAASTEFFRRLGDIPKSSLPLWSGELYLELHRGTLTTQAKTKRWNRRLEHLLHDVEFLCALSGVSAREKLDEIWKITLLNQFHDILPGSSIAWVYRDVADQAEQSLSSLQTIRDEALISLHGTVPETARAFVVYNTLSWDRHAVVEIPFDGSGTPVFSDVQGRLLIAQPVEGGYLVPITVPSMGHTGVSIQVADDRQNDERQIVGERPETATTPEAGRWSRELIIPVAGTEEVLENALLRVTLGEDGTLTSIYDKEFDREVLAAPANRLLLWEDYPYSWDAWDISHYYRETAPVQATLTDRALSESGPLRAAVEQSLEVGSSTISQRIVLEAESKLVRIETRVNWRESRKQLRVQATPDLRAQQASYEIQFGAVRRPAHGNTSWDAAQFEVCGHRFADYSQPDYGLGLVNDSKYGHYIRDGVMELTLLRSPENPDPDADRGEHEFVYGYYPHALGWEASDLLERAHELNAPIMLRAVSEPAEGSQSEFSVLGGGVKLDTVKPAEDGQGVIVRLYETRGARTSVVLRCRNVIGKATETNLLEEPLAEVPATASAGSHASEVALSFTPFQIRTFRLEQ